MNNLLNIKMDEDTGETLISGRELHKTLKVKTKYKDWFPRMIEYGFVENTDFILVAQKRETNNPKNPYTTYIDHFMKIDMAKEIAMIQRTQEGKEIRQYLIQVEKAWNSPEKIMERALLIAKNNINKLEIENAEMKPKAMIADAINRSEGDITVKQLAAILKQNGCDIGQNRLFDWLRDNKYLAKVGRNHNIPTQKSLEMGIMRLEEKPGVDANGNTRINRVPLITGKGHNYFLEKILGKEYVIKREKQHEKKVVLQQGKFDTL